MADEEIEIRFISTRAGSGGEDSIEEIDELNERTDELRNKTDELGESTEELGEGAQGSAGSMDDLINIERAQVAGQLAEVVNRFAGALQSMASQLEGIDPEAADRLNDVGLAVQSLGLGAEFAAKGFAVGGAFGAALGGAVGLITGPVKGAFEELVAELDALAKAEANATKMIAEANEMLRLRNESAQRLSIADFFAREAREIQKGSDALDRQVRLLQTKQQVEAAIAGEELKQDKIKGLDPDLAARRGTEIRVKAELDRLLTEIQKAENFANAAEERAANKALTASQITASSDGFTDADVRAAEQAAKQARDEADRAIAEAELLVNQTSAEASRILAEISTSFAEQASDGGDRVTEAAKEAIALFDQAEQDVGSISQNARTFRERLQGLISDQTADEEQIDQFRQLFELSRTTQEAKDQEVFDTVSGLIEVLTQTQLNFQNLKRDTERLQQQVNSLR